MLYMAVISYGTDVFATDLKRADIDGCVEFEDEVELKRVSRNFSISIVLYGIKIPRRRWYRHSIFTPPSKDKTFVQCGYTKINLCDIERNHSEMFRFSKNFNNCGDLYVSIKTKEMSFLGLN